MANGRFGRPWPGVISMVLPVLTALIYLHLAGFGWKFGCRLPGADFEWAGVEGWRKSLTGGLVESEFSLIFGFYKGFSRVLTPDGARETRIKVGNVYRE